MTGKEKKEFIAIGNEAFSLNEEDKVFQYQKHLTEKLDFSNGQFNQDLINEIVLWKINRYAKVEKEIFEKINSIDVKSKILNEQLTRDILTGLLDTKGIRLPMASTILRFKNPNAYQIIDQRVYRILYDKELSIARKPILFQIDLYLKYLVDLRQTSIDLKIPFEKIDRILYMADKRINGVFSLKNYGSKNKKS